MTIWTGFTVYEITLLKKLRLENVSSTSEMLYSGIYIEDADDYPKF